MDLLKYIKYNNQSFIISLIILFSLFFWEFDLFNINFRYIFLALIFLNFIIFDKADIKTYLYCSTIPILIIFHSYMSLGPYAISQRFIFSLIFAYLLLLIIVKNYRIIIEESIKLLKLYTFLINILGVLTIILAKEKLIFDEIAQFVEIPENYLCTFFNQNNFSLFRKVFFEPSHFAFINNSVVIYLFLNFKGIGKEKLYYSINFITYLFFSLVFFISATTYFGIIFSLIFIMIFMWKKIHKNMKVRMFILILICSFLVISNKPCANRILQLSKLDHIYNSIDFDQNQKEIEDINPIKNFLVSNINDINEIRNSNNVNFSTAVQGHSFVVALFSLIEKPFGYGFQNYQYAFDLHNQKFDFNILKDTFVIYNYNDGASNLNKALVEFGLLNFIFLILFIIGLLKNKNIEINLFLATAIITQLIRGAGYFNGNFLIIYFLFIFFNFEKNTK